MVVAEPSDFAAEIHDRMPVFLTDEQFAPWLSGEAGAESKASTERLSVTLASIEAGQ